MLFVITTFSQTNNIDSVYTYLEKSKNDLVSNEGKFSKWDKSNNILYLQRNCDLSLLIVRIWREREEENGEDMPRFILCSDINNCK